MLSESIKAWLDRQSEEVLIHCVSWNAFGVANFEVEGASLGLNPLCIVECFRRASFGTVTHDYVVLIHRVSWNAFGEVVVKTQAEAVMS